jgi:hypothetical protein
MYRLILLTLLSLQLGWAQNPDAAQSAARTSDAQISGEAAPRRFKSGNSGSVAADTGEGVYQILVENPDSLGLSASATSSFSWETNPAFSAEGDSLESAVFSQSATVRWQHTLGQNFIWDASAQELLYRYDAFESLDFDRSAVRSNLHYLGLGNLDNPILRNWILSAGGEWWRLNQGGKFNAELLTNTGINLAAQRLFTIDGANSLAISLTSTISLDASLEAAQRDEHGITAAWQTRWSPRWETAFFARAALYDYEARDDQNLSAGLSLTYAPTAHLAATVTATGLWNDSSDPRFDYQNLSIGVAASLRIDF